MKKLKNTAILAALCALIAASALSFKTGARSVYKDTYEDRLSALEISLEKILTAIKPGSLTKSDKDKCRALIAEARLRLKAADIWLRHLDPIAHKKINGPLPVEWETEVFEKFEKPYRREGAGLTLAELYLGEATICEGDSLSALITSALSACKVFRSDSITGAMSEPGHLYFCNRLFLLNLATIYTSGFECPAPERVVDELQYMLGEVFDVYRAYNLNFARTAMPENYLRLFREMLEYVRGQPRNSADFDHFTMIRDYINPLFALNQECISRYRLSSRSVQDYTLDKNARSIFSKNLYHAQATKGVFQRVFDEQTLGKVNELGKTLFFDPLLSGNNERSCASCHKPDQCFTDTTVSTAPVFDRHGQLGRNAPTLLNSQFNHLVMYDGRHLNLQQQAQGVITSTLEMACAEDELLRKLNSCSDYRKTLKALLSSTPQETEVGMAHVSSALTFYYGNFSSGSSPFDLAMNKRTSLDKEAQEGFNLFMGKAQCGTCHFAPFFNGVKPPYLGSEFEVLGVPSDTSYKELSRDPGRHGVHPAPETMRAFRTPGLRNVGRTRPYMHNGVFRTLEEVIDFYDSGGAAGRGLAISNQTLSADSLHLTQLEKKRLIAFMESLNEAFPPAQVPEKLPKSRIRSLNSRNPGGTY